ncbi:MAG: YhcH/YjgK/YiaL family protein [Chloroflexota bacterium]|nr:YhcH/YjgK/YiaL family protein [Chloroflexota bacterium]
MAIYGTIDTCAAQTGDRPHFAAVLFPEDGHAPLQAPGGVPAPSKRIVVKVRVAD